jgi:hypothetical protein
MSQTTYSETPAVAKAGLAADGTLRNTDSFACEGAVAFGLLVMQGTADNQAKVLTALPSEDVDAIVETFASAVTLQTLSGASLDGTISDGQIVPAQLVTATLNSHADWIASFMTVTGINAAGMLEVEKVAIPVGGNAKISTINVFKEVHSVAFDAQDGTNGTATVGVDPASVVLSQSSYLGVARYEPEQVPASSTAEKADGDMLSVITEGRVWVVTETAVVKNQQALVRVVEVGEDLRGQFGGDSGANFAVLNGARFLKTVGAGELTILELAG